MIIMDVIKEWLKKIDAEKKDENTYYIGESDIQINNECVLCNISEITIEDEYLIIFKMDNGWTTATYLGENINTIELN